MIVISTRFAEGDLHSRLMDQRQHGKTEQMHDRIRDYYATATPVSEGVLYYPDAIDTTGRDR